MLTTIPQSVPLNGKQRHNVTFRCDKIQRGETLSATQEIFMFIKIKIHQIPATALNKIIAKYIRQNY